MIAILLIIFAFVLLAALQALSRILNYDDEK
jgi:hypothetical protein